jgi:hypothetical protein
MTHLPQTIDIDDVPDLRRLVQELRESGESGVLREGGEPVALLVPLAEEEAAVEYPWRPKTPEDYEALRSAAGGWKGFDGEQFLREIFAAREFDAESDRSR